MPSSPRPARGLRSRRHVPLLVALLTGAALAALTGLALAQTFTLNVAKSGKVTDASGTTTVEPIAVNSHGSAVYDLVPETVNHVLCTQASGCLGFWFPVKVSSAHAKLSAATGIKGKLGTWHRNGFFQVTLAGHPLYTFKLDGSKKGVATGDKIKSFGGTWHVITAGAKKSSAGPTTTMTAPTTPTTTTCTDPPYCY
jgi:predicted lipoprotein with Yx(FWY)xxD motif